MPRSSRAGASWNFKPTTETPGSSPPSRSRFGAFARADLLQQFRDRRIKLDVFARVALTVLCSDLSFRQTGRGGEGPGGRPVMVGGSSFRLTQGVTGETIGASRTL